MYQFLRFELKKLRRTRFLPLCLLALFIVIIGYFIYVDQRTITVEEATMYLEESALDFQKGADEMEKELADKERETGRMQTELAGAAANSRIQADAHELMYDSIKNQDWPLYWKGELLNASLMVDLKEEELETILTSYRWPTPFTVFAYRDQMEWMEERDIHPIFRTDQMSWKTLYDIDYDFPFIQEVVMERSEKYSSSGVSFMYHVFQYGFTIGGIFLLLVLFADILTKEGFSRNGPIQLARTQPIRRSAFWAAKSATVVLGTVALTTLVAVLALMLGTLFERFGDWNYPVLIYGAERTYEIWSMTHFLAISFVLFLVMALFAFALLYLFSLLTDRALLSLGIVIIVFVVGQIITQQSLFLSWSHWLPFHYVDAYAIVSGRYAVIQDNTNLTFLQGIGTTIVWTVCIILLTVAAGKWKSGVQR